MTVKTTVQTKVNIGKIIKQILKYLGREWDVTTCSECGEPIVVENNTGEPQTCMRLDCVYQVIKEQL